jgi:DNA polymerase
MLTLIMKEELRDWCALQDVDPITLDHISPTPQNKDLSSRQLADRAKTLTELKTAIQNFNGCDLKKNAINTVISDGNPASQVMLIGEAPGATEDAKGIPFCGESGRLLDKVLASIGLVRTQNIYITNTIFWRPPSNRNPSLEETETCLPFVEKHIALIKPKLIILAGSVAFQTLFSSTNGLSKQRQKLLSYTNRYLDVPIPAAVIFHPSYLLRQPSQKKMAWHDMLFIKAFLEGLQRA